MSRDKIDVNNYFDSKGDTGIGNSDIMKALEDIDYDIAQSDIDSASPDELENEEFKRLLSTGVTVKNAYEVVHIDEVIQNDKR